MTVVTRFAPSPTGMLHIGGVRTALFSWLYARHTGGRFLLRVEDTDRERSTEEAVRVILEGMEWLALDADEKVVFQSQRFDRYREVLERMLQAGTAYRCYCTKAELDALREQQSISFALQVISFLHAAWTLQPRSGYFLLGSHPKVTFLSSNCNTGFANCGPLPSQPPANRGTSSESRRGECTARGRFN